MRLLGKMFFTLLVLGSLSLFAEEKKSKIANNHSFDKMKTLAGPWEGTADEGGKKVRQTRASSLSPTARP